MRNYSIRIWLSDEVAENDYTVYDFDTRQAAIDAAGKLIEDFPCCSLYIYHCGNRIGRY